MTLKNILCSAEHLSNQNDGQKELPKAQHLEWHLAVLSAAHLVPQKASQMATQKVIM